ncbi:hypothetical protein ACVME8_002461 [Bradyrhizobium diazoefficiens]
MRGERRLGLINPQPIMQKDGKRWPIGADYGTGCGVECPETIAETKGMLRLRILGSHTDDWRRIARDDKAERA